MTPRFIICTSYKTTNGLNTEFHTFEKIDYINIVEKKTLLDFGWEYMCVSVVGKGSSHAYGSIKIRGLRFMLYSHISKFDSIKIDIDI